MTRPPHCPDAALFHELLESTHCLLDGDIWINPGRAKNVHLFDTVQDAVTFSTLARTLSRSQSGARVLPSQQARMKSDLVRVFGLL